MDYQAHYNRLVERAKNRTVEGYVERHHILPRCMGGTNDKANIVPLTPEEHYVAHQLLVKIYPCVGGLVAAIKYMSDNTYAGNTGKKVRNNKMYGWLRKKVSKYLSELTRGKKQSPEHVAKRINAIITSGILKKPLSEQHIASLKMGKLKEREKRIALGLAHHNAGRKHTIEQDEKFRVVMCGRKQSPEHKTKRLAAMVATKLAKRESRGNII
jgi:hypothetical protein